MSKPDPSRERELTPIPASFIESLRDVARNTRDYETERDDE